MADLEFFEKTAAEMFSKTISFVGKLPGTAIISSGVVSAMNVATGADASSIVLDSTTATISSTGTKASFVVKAGTAGLRYLITLTVTLDNSYVFVETLTMGVR